jgi:hypothetical protein
MPHALPISPPWYAYINIIWLGSPTQIQHENVGLRRILQQVKNLLGKVPAWLSTSQNSDTCSWITKMQTHLKTINKRAPKSILQGTFFCAKAPPWPKYAGRKG